MKAGKIKITYFHPHKHGLVVMNYVWIVSVNRFLTKNKYMTQEQVNSLIRTVLTLIGAFLTGGGLHYLFGTVIDTAYWQEITGIILAIASVVWSIVSKTVDLEKLEGTIRQIVTFICGILLARGLLNAQTSMAVIAFVGAIIPLIQSYLAKKKSDQLVVGEIQTAQLKKSKP